MGISSFVVETQSQLLTTNNMLSTRIRHRLATRVYGFANRGLAVAAGDKIALADVKLQAARSWDDGVADGFKATSLAELFTGKKVALFAVPGAFTGVCSSGHVPSFESNAKAIKAKGVDSIVCVSVN